MRGECSINTTNFEFDGLNHVERRLGHPGSGVGLRENCSFMNIDNSVESILAMMGWRCRSKRKEGTIAYVEEEEGIQEEGEVR